MVLDVARIELIRPAAARAEFEQAPQRPDMFRCAAIPNQGGYPVNQVQDPRFAAAFEYGLTDTSDEAIAALVSSMAEDGAICIKLYIENGFGEASSWPVPDDQTIQKLRTHADSHGLLLYAHANAIDMYQIALRNQVDVIGHGLWNWQWPAGEAPPVEQTLEAVVAGGTGYMATHTVMAGLAAQLDAGAIDFEAMAKTVPAPLLAWYRTDEAQWFAVELASDFPPEAVFEAATLNNAKQLGLDDRYGTVEAGKVANLLLLQRDPTQSGTAWDTIQTVILRGKPIARETLAVQ